MRIVSGCAALLFAILLGPSMAPAQGTVTFPDDFLRLTVRTGIIGYVYSEDIGDIESDYTSVGPAWGINATLRPLDRVRVGVDYFGALVTSSTETWEEIGTFMGAPATQENELEVDYHTLDIEGGYSVVKEPDVEVGVWLGWHYYFQGFDRSDFRFRVLDLTIPFEIAPVSEDVSGQGVKVGATVEWRFRPRLTLAGGLAGYYLYAVDVDNSELGEIDSDGWAARWRLGVDYALTSMVTVGAGYEAHLVFVDEGESAIAVLPANWTWVHAGMVRLGIRF